MGGSIFISYRRRDTAGFAGRVFDRLQQAFPDHEIWFDVDSIPAARTYFTEILQAVSRCDLFLLVIGPR